MEHQLPLYGALVDLEKAFDRVDHRALLKILEHYGADTGILEQAMDLLTGTSARVRCTNNQGADAPARGLPPAEPA